MDGTLAVSSSSQTWKSGSNLLTGPLKERELAEVFDRVRTLLQIEVSDYQVYPGLSRAGGVHRPSGVQRQGAVIGFVALELGNQEVFRLFSDYNGLGETGETVVVMRTGKTHVRLRPPLRHLRDAAFKYQVADRR